MHPIALWLYAGRDHYNQAWKSIAKGTEVRHLDVSRAEIIHHLQVSHHQEEHHCLHQHPEEAGKEKIVQESRNDGTGRLQGRSLHIRILQHGQKVEGQEQCGIASTGVPQTIQPFFLSIM